MVPTLLYLLTVALSLYLPFWYPPMYEGPDILVMFAVALASSSQAGCAWRLPVPRLWGIPVAGAWALGSLSVTPFLSTPASPLQLTLRVCGLVIAGAVLVIAALIGVLRKRSLARLPRALYGLALLMMGAAFTAAGAWAVHPWGGRAMEAFHPVVIASAILTVAAAVLSPDQGRLTTG